MGLKAIFNGKYNKKLEIRNYIQKILFLTL